MKTRWSYSDFEDFVLNRLEPDTPCFYKLVRFTCDADGYTHREVKGIALPGYETVRGLQWAFPVGRFSEMDYEYYPTLEDAQKALSIPSAKRVFGYQISRLGYGRQGRNDYFVQYWSYDSDGRLFDRSSCSSYHWNTPGTAGKFFGRLPEQIAFREGEVVEICVSSQEEPGRFFATLGVVVTEPKSVKNVWEVIGREINSNLRQGISVEKTLEDPDRNGVDGEEYFILYGPVDESLSFATFRHPIEVRPPSFPVSKEAYETLMKYFNDYQNRP